MKDKQLDTTGSGEALTRREREKAAHRHEILQAAERVFAEKGFECATVEEIARAADFSVGAIYTFFENKEILWAEVFTRIGREFLETFRNDIGTEPNPLKAIAMLIDLKLSHVQKHAAFLRVVMEASAINRITPHVVIPKCCHVLYNEYIGEVAELLKKAMSQGLLRKMDPIYTALMLEGTIHAFKTYWLRQGINLSLDEQTRLVKKQFLAPLELQKGEK